MILITPTMPKFFNAILNHIKKYYDYKRCLQHEDIVVDSSAELINAKSAYFNNKSLEKDKIFNIDKKINSVTGWVPYLENKTSILIYNFFSTNYSIRKNLILKVSILKNYKICFVKFMTVKQYEIIELNKKFFGTSDINNGIVVAQLYHPNIPKNHGGGNGQLRFWGKYYDESNNYLSTVHSMPLNYEKYVKEKIHSRNYFPNIKNEKNRLLNISLNQDVVKNNLNKLSLGGYNIVLDQKNNPLSIWHLGPAYDKKKEYFELKKYNHCFWVPKNHNINPRIVIDNKETFIDANEKQILTIKIIKEEKIFKEKLIKFQNFYEATIEEIFDEKFKFEYIIYLEFSSKFFPYAQITYDSDVIGDQVHTHQANCFYDDKNKINFFEEKTEKNCRKFMHIPLNNDKYSNFLVLHNIKLKNKKTKLIKLRLLDEQNFEEVKNIEINNNKMIEVFNLNKLFEKNIKDENIDKAIIQLESKDYNFDASLICQNNNNDKIAVDHLTGG